MRHLRLFLRNNALTLVFGTAFLIALLGQAIAGQREFNQDLAADGLPGYNFGAYLLSSHFAVDTAENWQSEYLQFFLYIFGTVWLLQKGSPESKPPGRSGKGTDHEQKVGRHAAADSPRWAAAHGLRQTLYARSLGTVMCVLFLGSWLAQSIAGAAAYNEQNLRRLQAPLTWSEYLGCADFWSRTLQNWQSEFLALASMAVLSVYLRHRGSPESKPVGAPHDATGVEG